MYVFCMGYPRYIYWSTTSNVSSCTSVTHKISLLPTFRLSLINYYCSSLGDSLKRTISSALIVYMLVSFFDTLSPPFLILEYIPKVIYSRIDVAVPLRIHIFQYFITDIPSFFSPDTSRSAFICTQSNPFPSRWMPQIGASYIRLFSFLIELVCGRGLLKLHCWSLPVFWAD